MARQICFLLSVNETDGSSNYRTIGINQWLFWEKKISIIIKLTKKICSCIQQLKHGLS
jgi:hypothetical protein